MDSEKEALIRDFSYWTFHGPIHALRGSKSLGGLLGGLEARSLSVVLKLPLDSHAKMSVSKILRSEAGPEIPGDIYEVGGYSLIVS